VTPLGGAILMSLVPSDGLFANQTEAGFKKVMDAKWGALLTFNNVRPIKNLDFFHPILLRVFCAWKSRAIELRCREQHR